jgi:ribosome biogenesis GTPase
MGGVAPSMAIRCCKTSVTGEAGLEELRGLLKDKSTVLAGHSGVGKSSLIAAIEPGLDIRIGEVSEFTSKGRHTTTSARHYDLKMGGCVIDTPGVKMFGLWDVTRENLRQYFPDVVAETAPAWRKESFERISESLRG